jgi:hypothetical protein
MNNCPHCGMIHQTTCPRIKSIEYHENGVTVKRIEFHAPEPVVAQPQYGNLRILDGPSNSYGFISADHAAGTPLPSAGVSSGWRAAFMRRRVRHALQFAARS